MSNLSYSLTMLTCNASRRIESEGSCRNFYDLLTVYTVLHKTRKKGLFNRDWELWTIMKAKNIFGLLCSSWNWLSKDVHIISFLGKEIVFRKLHIKGEWAFVWQKHGRLLHCHDKTSPFSSLSMYLRAKTYVAGSWSWL